LGPDVKRCTKTGGDLKMGQGVKKEAKRRTQGGGRRNQNTLKRGLIARGGP